MLHDTSYGAILRVVQTAATSSYRCEAVPTLRTVYAHDCSVSLLRRSSARLQAASGASPIVLAGRLQTSPGSPHDRERHRTQIPSILRAQKITSLEVEGTVHASHAQIEQD